MYEKGCSNSKEENKKAKKTIPLKTEEDSNLRLLVTKSFSVKMLANFRRKHQNGEKILQHKCSIYRGKGGSFKKRLDSTVAIFPGDACPL
jgi:hypothetical protein